jgi:hydroxymethylbilane synthase
MKIRIGSRKSHLARLQSFQVGDALLAAYPNLEIEYFFKESLGDKNLTDPLWKMPERGVFTEDFVQDLLENRVDLVVHSWKDLPTEARPGLKLFGTLKRADQRDLLLFRKQSLGNKNLKLLTSSPRREFSAKSFLQPLLPFAVETLNFQHVRGNVSTRIRKLVQGEGDGLFMAKAALDRLLSSKNSEFSEAQKEIREYLEHLHWMVLPLSHFPTAAAQGAIAIEGLETREDLAKALEPLLCKDSALNVEEERKLFRSFGGGCHQKIGISVQQHSRLGRLQFFYGYTDTYGTQHWMKAEKSAEFEQANKWPQKPSPAFFRRSPIECSHPGTDLFVTRSEALPEWKMGNEVIWCAGIDSWRKLAKRGLWVNGCQDGLGEEIPEIEALLGRSPNFTKLTHDRSENTGTFPVLATYRLENREFSPPQAESYFWMSETSFLRALELDPSLKNAKHACGPGYTAAALEKVLGKPVSVYINYRHWRDGNPFSEESNEN